jgi:hypothetical protein
VSTETLDIQMNFEQDQQAEADKKLFVVFYRSTEKNATKSVEAGRPIFDEMDLIKIISPGSRDSFVGIATEEYQARFPTQWARYKNQQDQNMSGTPLNQLPWLGIGQIEELKAVNCHTVEQLVGMPDSISQKFMGHHAIKQRAEAYLNAAKDAAPMLKLQTELDKRDEQIAELQAQMKALIASQTAQKVPNKA